MGLNSNQIKRIAGMLNKKATSKRAKPIKKQSDEQRKEYYTSMRSYAKDIVQEAQELAASEGGEVEDYISEKISKYAEETEWVIYTGKALSVLNNSDKWLAAEEATGEDITPKISEWAYYAIEADLHEYVEAFMNEGVPEDV